MPTFKYRLQPLLEQKIRLKEEAAENFAQKQQQLRTATDKLNELRREQDALAEKKVQLRQNLLIADGGSLSGMGIQRRLDYLKAVHLDLEAAKDGVFAQNLFIDDCKRQVEEAQAQLTKCSRDEEVLQKHRDKLQQRFLREAERLEALEQDEIGNMMHMRRSQES